jgi:hypothetical protein
VLVSQPFSSLLLLGCLAGVSGNIFNAYGRRCRLLYGCVFAFCSIYGWAHVYYIYMFYGTRSCMYSCMQASLYVCMLVYHACIYVCTIVCMNAFVNVCACVCVCERVCVCESVCLCVHINTRTRMYT